MANNQRIEELLLRFRVDRASAAKAAREIRDFQGQLGALRGAQSAASLGALGPQTAANVERTTARIRTMRTELARTASEADALHRALRENAAVPRARAAGGGGGSLGSSVTTFGRQLFNLPSVSLGGITSDQLGRMLRGAGAGLDAVGASARSLAVAGPIAAAAVVAVAIAVDRFNESLKASKSLLQGAISASDAYYEALKTKSTAAALEMAAELERTAPIVKQQLDELKAARESAFAQGVQDFDFGTGSSALGDALTRTFDRLGVTSSQQLAERIDELDAEFNSMTQTAVRLRQGVEQGVFADNDAREAEMRLAEARRASAAAALSDVQEQAALMAGTAEQARERRTALETEAEGLRVAIAMLEEAGDTSAETAKQIDAYRTALEGVESDIQTVNRLMPQVRLAEALRGTPEVMAALQKNVAAFNAEVERVRNARTLSGERDQFDFMRQRQRALADFDRQQAQQEIQQVQREGELRARIAEIDAESNAEAIAETQAFNQEQQRAAEDHQQRIAQITADAAYDLESAISARSSQQAQAAVRERQRAIAEEQQQYDTEKARREQDFAEQEAARKQQASAQRAAAVQALADAQAQYAAERQLREQEFQLRIEAENEDRRLRLERQAADYAQEDEARRKALQDKQEAIIRDARANGELLTNASDLMSGIRSVIVDNLSRMATDIGSIRIQAPTINYGMQQSSVGNMSYAPPNVSSQAWMQQQQSGGAGGLAYRTRFAEGGIVPANRHVIGEFERNRSYAEAVIPLRPHILREIGGGGRGSTTVQLNIGKGAVNVTAREGQDARSVANEVVTQFAEAAIPQIMHVIESRTR